LTAGSGAACQRGRAVVAVSALWWEQFLKLVDDNQLLKKRDPIAGLDPRDYDMALAQARANLSSTSLHQVSIYDHRHLQAYRRAQNRLRIRSTSRGKLYETKKLCRQSCRALAPWAGAKASLDSVDANIPNPLEIILTQKRKGFGSLTSRPV
jgi:hypothetical protein